MLSIKNISKSNLSIIVYDFQGKILLSESKSSGTLDFSNIPSGIYLMKITDSGNFKAFKVIKK